MKGISTMTKNFVEARKKLIDACEGYMKHNQHELDGLKAVSPQIPKSSFFYAVFRKYEPDPGFRDWICCQYYSQLWRILSSLAAKYDCYDYHRSGYYGTAYPFEELKWWNENETRYYEKEVDHTAPETVLHNLRVLLNLFNFHMEKIIPPLEQKRIDPSYKENDLSTLNNAPLSIQIYKTLENLKLRARFAESIVNKTDPTRFLPHIRLLPLIYETIEEASSVYEGYLKGVAVSELNAILKNPDLNDKEAIHAVEEQLKNGITLELLSKNRQSKIERDLKLLSIISIFIGIGVFTTLGLVCKRLYDSGGTSINFFKPLSQNLYETIDSIATDIEDEPKCSKLS